MTNGSFPMIMAMMVVMMMEKFQRMISSELYELLLCPGHWVHFWLRLLWLTGRSNHNPLLSVCLRQACSSQILSIFQSIRQHKYKYWDSNAVQFVRWSVSLFVCLLIFLFLCLAGCLFVCLFLPLSIPESPWWSSQLLRHVQFSSGVHLWGMQVLTRGDVSL